MSAGRKVTDHAFLPHGDNSNCDKADTCGNCHEPESAHRSAPPEKCCDSQVPHGHAVGPPRAAAPDNAEPTCVALQPCLMSDAWRCARQKNLSGQIACHCACHRPKAAAPDNAEDRLRAKAEWLYRMHSEGRWTPERFKAEIHAALEAAIADARQSWRSRMGLSGTNAEALDVEYQKGRAAGVAEEREACAARVEKLFRRYKREKSMPWDFGRTETLEAIRARGLEEKP